MLEVDEIALEVGSIVEGRFRLVRILGEGGMGTVWHAEDVVSGEARALKFVRRDKEDDPRAMARLVREARATQSIEHPNVARVLEVGELPAGTPFLVMDLLRGETLRDRLDREERLSPESASRILADVADGVAAAHARGVVHRDLKPENVFLVAGAPLKVLDFGVAKDLRRGDDTASLTQTGAMLGTLHYMAPEQIYGDLDVDERADTWALGVIAFECVTGKRPTEGIGTGQVIKAITVGPTKTLAEVAPACPKALTDLVARMLSRARDPRPSMSELARAFRGEPLPSAVVAAATPQTARTVPRPKRPYAVLSAFIALGVLSTAAVVTKGVWSPSSSTLAPQELALLPTPDAASTITKEPLPDGGAVSTLASASKGATGTASSAPKASSPTAAKIVPHGRPAVPPAPATGLVAPVPASANAARTPPASAVSAAFSDAPPVATIRH